jgi:uncharacterized membrane protein YciS (DUF1049 family)
MIRWAKRIILIVALIVALVLGITFTSENSQLVSPVFYGYLLIELQLGLWLMMALFIGGGIVLLLSFLPLLWGKKTAQSNERKIQALKKEINQLRSASLKG